MTKRPCVLVELGEELDRAAQRALRGKRRGGSARLVAVRFPSLAGVVVVFAAASAMAVAAVAILVVGHQHPVPGKAASGRRSVLASPRGEIVDRHGTPLVKSRRTYAVKIVPRQLPVAIRDPSLSQLAAPPAADKALYRRLAGVLGIKTTPQMCTVDGHHLRLTEIACEVAQTVYKIPYADATVATDVRRQVFYYLSRHKRGFPGVTEAQVYVTSYPYGPAAAQVLGTVGPITPAELKQSQFSGLPANSIVGQTGLEGFYDQYLRGRDGRSGETLKTSLDLKLQLAAQASLARSLSVNRPADAGAFVAMNPQNGQIYAMGSLPSYNSNIFTRPIPQSVYKNLISATSGDPLNNRAVDGLYPVGSTFKPITAIAALESGVWGVNDTYDDTGQYCFSQGLCMRNSGNVANGVLDLVNAIRVSDDVFFYNLGAKLNVNPQTHPQGGPLQQWARLFGIGQATGIDLPYEASGNLPDPKWRAAISRVELQYEKQHHRRCCTIASPGPWTVGDNVNLAVGQGDVSVTPLQLAVAYSAIANGGAIVRPHIGFQIDNSLSNKVLRNIDPPPTRQININPVYLDAIRQGLRAAASAPGGTSADVMSNFPEPVYGKTGSAQHVGQPDQAWYACYVPATATTKPIAVVVTAERGGFGAVAAAPVARQILSQWFFGKLGPYVAGKSTTP
jgi:penicillin-binding protein 2